MAQVLVSAWTQFRFWLRFRPGLGVLAQALVSTIQEVINELGSQALILDSRRQVCSWLWEWGGGWRMRRWGFGYTFLIIRSIIDHFY